MKHFPESPLRFTMLSQYTLRYRYVTGSGLRPDTPKGRCVARNISQYTLRYRYVTGSGLRPDTPKGRCVARNTLA
ncbi:hypothetical protein EAI62_25610 [Escherichia coli]|nr:hypothetical protein EAI62_25610 [Escherichia coli]